MVERKGTAPPKIIIPLPDVPDWTKVKNHSEVLRDNLVETNLIVDGMQRWQKLLATWQQEEKITPKEFEEGYIILCEAGLLDWVEDSFNLEELYQDLTKETPNQERLLSLAKEFKRGGFD